MKRRILSLNEFINESEKVINDATWHGDTITFGFNYKLVNRNNKLAVYVTPGHGSDYYNETGITLKNWSDETKQNIVDALNGLNYTKDGVTGAISRPMNKKDMKLFASKLTQSLDESEFIFDEYEFLHESELLLERQFVKPDMIKTGSKKNDAYILYYIYGYEKNDGEYSNGEKYKKGDAAWTHGDARLFNVEKSGLSYKEMAEYVVKKTHSSFSIFKHAFPDKDALDCARKLVTCILGATKDTRSNREKNFDWKSAVDGLVEKWKNK